MLNHSDIPDDVSVVIVNYNAGDRLVECVESVFRHNAGVEVIVVDNASADNSLDLLVQVLGGHKPLRIHKNERNLGFSAACNLGMRLARFDQILFLNPDCLLEQDSLRKLATCLSEQKKAGMVGGLLLNPDGSEQAGGRRLTPTPARALARVLNLSLLSRYFSSLSADFNLHCQPLPRQPLEVEAISGACMLVKREAVDDVGPWDEGYFLHCEDLDWCMRFRQKGWRILFVPDARIFHAKGACSCSRPVFVEWHKHKGMVRFYRKFFRERYSSLFMLMVIASVWMRFGLVVLSLLMHRALDHLRR